MNNNQDRPEEWEIKGRDLFNNRNAQSNRTRFFLKDFFDLLNRFTVKVFSIITIKNPTALADETSIYTTSFQYLLERFSIYLIENHPGKVGSLILDSRGHHVDLPVLRSHMSFIFGNETGRQLVNIAEAPLCADSKFTAGLQVADVVSFGLFAYYYQRNCSSLAGAINYQHIDDYWPNLSALEFVSRNKYDGYIKRGYRIIDHNRT